MKSFIDKFDFDVFLGTEILLNFILSLIPHIVLYAEVKTQLLILFQNIMR